MLAGPGDVRPHLELIERVAYEWNRERTEHSSIVLLPRHWSTDSVSSFSLGADGQAEINKQLVEKADIVFAVFHAKLGTKTPRAVSGTAEEVEKAITDGLPVHVFFSEEPIPYEHDREQYTALLEFRKSLEDRGLYRTFVTEDDLRGLVRQSFEADVAAFNAPAAEAASPGSAAGGAKLIARYDYREVTESDSRGRVQTRKKGERIVIRNDGDTTAHNVTLNIEPRGDGEAPYLFNDSGSDVPTFEAIAPGTEVGVLIALHMGVALTQHVTLRWQDDEGKGHTYSHTITL
ncbi:hypothetical protein GS486_18170 [Rhodococcus hoagii]|nr:hypothetical protein [Prescottella equi]